MTLDDRIIIEKDPFQQHSLRSIVSLLEKPTTTSKEIKIYCTFQKHNHFDEQQNKYTLGKGYH